MDIRALVGALLRFHLLSLRKVEFVVHIRCVLVTLASAQSSCCHLRRQGCIVFSDFSTLITPKSIASQVRIVGIEGSLDLLSQL